MRKAALFSLVLLALPLASTPAAAAKPPVVVELFTAQGCASCGEANAHVAKLADKPGVLALTFSVDYWDYLGWADTFAKPEFAERQKAYVAKLALREPSSAPGRGGRRRRGGQARRSNGSTSWWLTRQGRPATRPRSSSPRIGSMWALACAPKGGGEVWLIRYDPREQRRRRQGGRQQGSDHSSQERRP